MAKVEFEKRWSLHGTTALVTGGSKGIGQAIVEELASLGAKVHTCARNQEDLDKSLQHWQSLKLNVTGSICDVSSRAERDKLMELVSSLRFNLNQTISPALSPAAAESKQVLYEVLRDENGNVKFDCPAIGKQFAAEILVQIQMGKSLCNGGRTKRKIGQDKNHLIAGRGGTQLERPGCRKVFNADTSEVKPNLGVGAYRTEEMQPYALNVVKNPVAWRCSCGRLLSTCTNVADPVAWRCSCGRLLSACTNVTDPVAWRSSFRIELFAALYSTATTVGGRCIHLYIEVDYRILHLLQSLCTYPSVACDTFIYFRRELVCVADLDSHSWIICIVFYHLHSIMLIS
ncbi:hypothetical protein KFK09_021596 [Dendrobium nobile]|uniref:Uncharacterized protein n=1 Tax=Dendrobium nobile TaxID=94219 RepID=A0A8T3AW74_DENNO|nr:hypothetical protein KFK09_021596 [Dendrobium nobile]